MTGNNTAGSMLGGTVPTGISVPVTSAGASWPAFQDPVPSFSPMWYDFSKLQGCIIELQATIIKQQERIRDLENFKEWATEGPEHLREPK